MTRRSWALALLVLLLAVAPAQAQSRIFWSVDLPNQVKEINSMNPDGSNKGSLFPGGLSLPAGYESFGSVVGPSVGTYPLDSSNPGSPRVRWFLTILNASLRHDLFAFAPDGAGGVVWRQLSEISSEPEVGLRVYLTPSSLALPTSLDDSFVSMTIQRGRYDGPTFEESTAWVTTNELVRLPNPFERAALSVDLDAFETFIPEWVSDNESFPFWTWSPDGRSVAYRARYPYPDNSYRPTIWVYDSVTGLDAPLFDPRAAGLYPGSMRWSPDGREIAFGWTSNFSTDDPGTFAVTVGTGAIRAIARKGRSSNYFAQPVWSPDGTLIAAVQFYAGNNYNMGYRYAIGRFPSSGVTKKNGTVLLTPTSEPYRYHTILNWR